MRRELTFTAAEDAQLLALARTHGHRWGLVHHAWSGHGRTVNSLRCRHKRLMALHGDAVSEGSSGPSEELQGGAFGEGLDVQSRAQMRSLAEQGAATEEESGGRTTAQAHAEAVGDERCAYAIKLQRPEGLERNYDWMGRPWDRAVTRDAQRRSRGETLDIRPSHEWLLRALRLRETREPHRLLFCDLERAVRAWERRLKATGEASTRRAAVALMKQRTLTLQQRDEWNLVCYDGLDCHDAMDGAARPGTLLACGSRRYWIGGPAAGCGFYADAQDAGRWMGHAACCPTGSRLPSLVARQSSDASAWAMHCDGMAMPQAIAAVDAADKLTDGKLLGAEAVRYGALYAGAWDTLGGALRLRAAQRGARFDPVMAAESRKDRRDVLRRTAGAAHIYTSSERAARWEQRPVDLLSWTPPCKDSTRGGLLSRVHGNWAIRKRRSTASMAKAVCVLSRCALATKPRVIIGETTASLFTHQRGAGWLVKWAMRSLLRQYTWHVDHCSDAAELGAAATRQRAILIGIARTQ